MSGCKVHDRLFLAYNQARSAAGQTPKEVLDYLKKKAVPIEHHSEVWAEEHSAAFAVARATELRLVETMQAAVQDALAEGLPLKEFQKRVTPELQARGWWGRREDGVQLGSPARLKVIYETNVRVARAAGAWKRIEQAQKALPYLRYRHGNPQRARPDHESWDGRVLPVDHEWWNYAYPPNGYGCTCWVEQISSRDAKASGVTPDDAIDLAPIEVRNPSTGKITTTVAGVQPTFAYNPGKSRLEGLRQAGIIGKGKKAKPKAAPPALRLLARFATYLEARLGPAAAARAVAGVRTHEDIAGLVVDGRPVGREFLDGL